jgi:hypothetical protein
MSIVDSISKILVSGRIPASFVRGVVHLAVAAMNTKMHIDEIIDSRRFAKITTQPTANRPSIRLYFVDGYHGGVIFWDWLIVPGGGLWHVYNWPLCVKPVIKRGLRDSRFKVVLDFDAYTYEWMKKFDSRAAHLVRSAFDAGILEIVNGTYGQPFGFAESGESFIRQLELGNKAMYDLFGSSAKVFYSQEPSYFAQLPQILALMGYKGAVFRTQWAAFGTDPAHDADLISWTAPDGSEIPTVPRYTFQNYKRQLEHHPGLAAGSLGIGEKPDWAPESFNAFAEAALASGITHPLISDLKDVNLPEAPLPRAIEIAATDNIEFTTLQDYFKIANPPSQKVFHGPHDIPCTLPWGLMADEVPKATLEAESALRVAESLDAVLCYFKSDHTCAESLLIDAWKSLCIAQQHDLYVCGPWLSLAHRKPMGHVAVKFADVARSEAARITAQAMASISASQSCGSGGIIIFNSASYGRYEYIEVKVPKTALSIDKSQWRGLSACSGNEVYPCQIISEDESQICLGFTPFLQGLSFKYFFITKEVEQYSKKEVKINPPFDIQYKDKEGLAIFTPSGKKLIEGLYITCMRNGKLYDSLSSMKEPEWIANGPVIYILKVEGNVAELPFILTLRMYPGIKRIDASVRFDFGDGPTYLGPQIDDYPPGTPYSIRDEAKLCVAFRVDADCICCKSPFWISEVFNERITGVNWIGLESSERDHLVFINRGNRGYHWDKKRNILRQVLAWAPREWIYASDDSFTRGKSAFTALSGIHTFDFAIAPYSNRIEAERESINYTTPMVAVWQNINNTKMPDYITSSTAFMVDSDKIFVTAFLVQNGNIIARLWNASENEVTCSLRSYSNKPIFVKETGSKINSWCSIKNNMFSFRPWGIYIFKIR